MGRVKDSTLDGDPLFYDPENGDAWILDRSGGVPVEQ
jgi:hypothetical protein